MRLHLSIAFSLLAVSAAPLAAQRPAIVRDVRSAINAGDFARAEKLLAANREQGGVTSAWLEALSWMGRGKLAAKDYGEASRYAGETRKLSLEMLKNRELDADSSLPLALGAAIEVLGQAMAAQGARAEAVTFYRDELATWRSSSIRARIQKNLHLINLEGKRAPLLEADGFLGAKPEPLPRLRGKTVLLFFWAHWCGDCKASAPAVARLAEEYAAKGLVVVAPTQPYGYVAGGEEAPRDKEIRYIDEIRAKFYGSIKGMAVPVSEENFKSWGASTTPTFALIDKDGTVRLYHPGRLSYDELKAKIEPLLPR
jgi:thiol-disulfide isomerase/thioredoxin